MITRRALLSSAMGSYLIQNITQEAFTQNRGQNDWLKQAADQFLKETNYPGIWIAIAKNGKYIRSVCAGYANMEKREVATADHVIRVGSISKPVAGTIIAYHVKKGKIRYEDKLYDVVPEYRKQGLPEYSTVTLSMLLTHASGLGDKFPKVPVMPKQEELTSIRAKSILLALNEKPLCEPGTAWNYSGAGIDAAVKMLERKTGKAYEQILNEVGVCVFGLKSIGMGTPATLSTQGYNPNDRNMPVLPILKASYQYHYEWGSAGSIHMTISDLCRFGCLHCLGTSPVFKTEELEYIHSDIINRSTLASLVRTESGRAGYRVGHAGSMANNTGHCAGMWIAPKFGALVVTYTNMGQPGATDTETLRDKATLPVYRQLLSDIGK